VKPSKIGNRYYLKRRQREFCMVSAKDLRKEIWKCKN
jgi:hypothetical protein